MSIQDFLTISSAVAAGGFIVSGLHEWRAARRIVPVAGLNAAMVAKHGCVPTQFAGSRHKPESTGVVGVWGWSRPRKRPPDLRRLWC